MDGEITIGTTLSTDKFDRQILDLEKKMQKEENKKLTIQADLGSLNEEFEIARKKTDELADAYQRLDQLQKTIASGKATPQQFTMAQDIQNTYGNIQQIEVSFMKALNKQDEIELKAQKTKERYEEINQRVAEYKQKIEGIQLQKQVADVNRMKESFNNVGSSIRNAIGQVGRLALGLFGIRSAYLGVRQAISTLSQYNSTLANQIQAIKLALITAIEPIINFIVGVVSKVVSFIGYILKMLFGIDIFARATALSFGKISAGASGASKSVKEMRKQLAGFDEATVLNKDGSVGALGGIGGGGAGSVNDLSDALKKLNDDSEKVFKNFRKWLLGSNKKTFKGVWNDNMKIIKDFIGNVKNTLTSVGKIIFKPLKDGFKQIMDGMQPLIEPVKRALKNMVEDVKPIWNSFINNYLKPLWSGLVSFMKPKVVDPIIKTFTPLGRQIYNSLVPYANEIIKLINQTFGVFGVNLKEWEYKTEESTGNVNSDFTGTLNDMEKNSNKRGKQIEKDINNPLGNIKDKIKEVAKQTLSVNTNTSKLDTFASKLKNIWERLKAIVKGNWEFAIRASGGGGTGSFGYGGGGGTRAHGGIYYPSKLPKLASGGIINQPGRGVPYNGAIIGERGAEAVVPLTDSKQMELLGATIGKYITINANVINTMNGRVISRELKQINNEQDFAFNT